MIDNFWYFRIYIQPQWIFDSINENTLLPVADYLPGAVLPPHLSPFVDNAERGYIPPEKPQLNVTEEVKLEERPKVVGKNKENIKKDKKETKVDDENDEEHIDMKVDLESPDEEEESEEEEEEEEEEEKKTKETAKPKIAVFKAKPQVENRSMLLSKQKAEEKRLTEMMMPKKDKRLYDRIVHSKKMKKKEVNIVLYFNILNQF